MILGCQFLEPFLIWVLWDDSGIQLFLCQEWHLVIGIWEVIYKELCCEFFSKMHFDKASTRWADRSISSFRLGDASRSCNLIDLGRRLGIYLKEETTSPHFYAYLDSCIIELPQEYGYMQVQGHTRGPAFIGQPRRIPSHILLICCFTDWSFQLFVTTRSVTRFLLATSSTCGVLLRLRFTSIFSFLLLSICLVRLQVRCL